MRGVSVTRSAAMGISSGISMLRMHRDAMSRGPERLTIRRSSATSKNADTADWSGMSCSRRRVRSRRCRRSWNIINPHEGSWAERAVHCVLSGKGGVKLLKEAAADRISVGTRIAYGCGDTACNIVYGMISSLMTLFYTDYAGISPITADLAEREFAEISEKTYDREVKI